MAPYADSRPCGVAGAPVRLVLAFGADSEETLMECEEHDAVGAVRELRDAEGDSLMDVDLPWEQWDGSQQSSGTLVVLDTNILLGYLPHLRALVGSLAEAAGSGARPALEFCVPHVVVQELDGLKSSARMTKRSLLAQDAASGPSSREASIGSLSRAASNWLLDVLPTPGTPGRTTFVRGQRQHESLLPRVNGRRNAGGSNDDEILDVARYFRQELGRDVRVVLLSDDKNLCLKVEDVATLSLDDTITPRSLLVQLDPILASSVLTQTIHNTPPPKCKPSPHSSPTKSRTPASASHSNGQPPRSPRRPPLTPSPSPPRPPPPPKPFMMELDYEDIILPDCTPPPPPTPRAIRRPADVVQNAGDLLAFFTASYLYSHIFKHLKKESPETYQDWVQELGDWRRWDGQHTVAIARRWWQEGDIKEICRLGIESSNDVPPAPTLPPPAPRSTTRATHTSRWSSVASPPPPPPILHPPLPISIRSPAAVAKSLSDLLSILPALTETLAFPYDALNSLSAIRLEIFLEHIHTFLSAVLGGLLGGGVAGDMAKLVAQWAGDLRSAGVALDPTLYRQ